MKLISEYTENDTLQCITEKKEDGTKEYVIEGVFAQAIKRTETDVFTPNLLWKGR